jgi:hypothetical protein
MTTNVPQDVIDDANAAKAELTYRCAYADMEICPCEAADSDNCHEQIVHGIKFTAKTWGKFAQLRAQRQQGSEPVPVEAIGRVLAEVMDLAVANGANSVSMPNHYVEIAGWLSGVAPDTPPQSNALVAAGMVKAAEICQSVSAECSSGEASYAAETCANRVISSIPADSQAALREVCMKVAEKAIARGITEPYTADALAIVNSVLEGKS